MRLPRPDLAEDWKSWAYRLIKRLERPDDVVPIQLPTFAIANLPSPNRDGLIVFALDDVNGAQPVYSRGGVWRRFTDGSQTSTT